MSLTDDRFFRRSGPFSLGEIASHVGGELCAEAPAALLIQGVASLDSAGEGELSVFSFYPNKHVTTGEGGMIMTDDDSLAERCRGLRNLCFEPPRRFVHRELGWNMRMSNLQAAVGVAQLERLDEFVARKREIGRLYREKLGNFAGISAQPHRTDFADNIYWVYGLVLDDEVPFVPRARIFQRAGG